MKLARTIALSALIIFPVLTNCLKFEENPLDSTGAGAIIPALFATILGNSAQVAGLLLDRTGAKVTSTSLTFTSNAFSRSAGPFGVITGSADVSTSTDGTGSFSTTLTVGTHTLTFDFGGQTYNLTFTVNSDGTSSATSSDGSSFFSNTPVSAGSFMAVAVGNDTGCFAYYSTDLTSWQAVSLPSNLYACDTIRHIIYADGVFVAVGEDSSAMPQCYIAVSSDGINWTQKGCQAGLDTALYAVAQGNGIFMATGRVTGGAPTVRIGDAQGANWSTVNTGTDTQTYSTAYFNGAEFFTGQLSGASAPTMYRSADPNAVNFSQVDGANCTLTGAPNSFQDFAGGPGLNFLGVANDGSNNGLMYSPFTNPVCTVTDAFSASTDMRGAAYDPFTGTWVGVGHNCRMDISSDGINWLGGPILLDTGANCVPTINWDRVIYSKTRKEFLAVGVQTTNLDPFIAVSSTGAQDSWTITQIFNAAGGANPISIAIRE